MTWFGFWITWLYLGIGSLCIFVISFLIWLIITAIREDAYNRGRADTIKELDKSNKTSPLDGSGTTQRMNL